MYRRTGFDRVRRIWSQCIVTKSLNAFFWHLCFVHLKKATFCTGISPFISPRWLSNTRVIFVKYNGLYSSTINSYNQKNISILRCSFCLGVYCRRQWRSYGHRFPLKSQNDDTCLAGTSSDRKIQRSLLFDSHKPHIAHKSPTTRHQKRCRVHTYFIPLVQHPWYLYGTNSSEVFA